MGSSVQVIMWSLVLVCSLGWGAVMGISESFTRKIRTDHQKFSCSFHLVYSPSALDLRKTKAFCTPNIRSSAKKLYILAPSGYRFTVDMDINHPPSRVTRLTAATVQVPSLRFVRRKVGDIKGARHGYLSGPDDWDGLEPMWVWNGRWAKWVWNGRRTSRILLY